MPVPAQALSCLLAASAKIFDVKDTPVPKVPNFQLIPSFETEVKGLTLYRLTFPDDVASVGDIDVVIGTRASRSTGCVVSVGVVCHSAGDLVTFPGVYEVKRVSS